MSSGQNGIEMCHKIIRAKHINGIAVWLSLVTSELNRAVVVIHITGDNISKKRKEKLARFP